MRRILVVLFVLIGVGCQKKAEHPTEALRAEVRRVASSRRQSPRDILPYDDAIAWDEYEVIRVVAGDWKEGRSSGQRIRVAHWTVRHGMAVPMSDKLGDTSILTLRPMEAAPRVATSDELDIAGVDLPRFFDLTWELAQKSRPEYQRFDYGGILSDQMKIYWKLRPQLRLVIMGSSHATNGLSPRGFFDGANWKVPVAMNLAPPGSYNAQQCLMVREYLMDLPKLEWVLWEIGPRSFNSQRRDDTRKLSDFLNSTGYHYDQAHRKELWPVPPSPAVTNDELKKLDINDTDLWGWQPGIVGKLPEDPREAHAALLRELGKPAFTFDDDAWREFAATVRALNEKGLRVLLLTTPLHPICNESPALDIAGSTREGQREVVRRAQALAADLPLTWFRDFQNDGHHDFTHADFFDAGHLNRNGASKFTARVAKWMEECRK